MPASAGMTSYDRASRGRGQGEGGREGKMIAKSYCARMDHGGCGLLVHVEDGRIVRIEGDPDSPLNRGTVCAKGIAQVERLGHPDRLKHPLKRVGERGEGKWERISWDEALSLLARQIEDRVQQGQGRS